MSERLERWRHLGSDRLNGLAALVIVAVSLAILAHSGFLTSPHDVATSISVLGFSALVALRRRQPIVVAILAGALIALPEFTANASAVNASALSLPGFAAVFLFAYALGSGCPWRASLIGLLPLIAGVTSTARGFNPLVEMVTIGPWLGGVLIASRRRLGMQLELRVRELEDEREIFAVEAVRYERARIARELHDIVAHCVTLMVVQATAGEQIVSSDPAAAAEAFASISETALEADAEIDRLVDLLADTGAASHAPGLQIVEELVRRTRASGLTVSCHFRGECEAVGEECAELAYRVVQESVTNAMKYAPGAPIMIGIHGRGGSLEVRVVNDRARSSRSGLEEAGGGHGLAGMRDRILDCDGTFAAGPTGHGGWQVTTSFPRRQPREGESRARESDLRLVEGPMQVEHG